MAEFSKLVVPKPSRTTQQSASQKESTFWKSYKSPIFLKSYAPVTHVHFSESTPHRYVVTSGTRLQVYSPKTNRVVKTISRFKETARSGEIRADGKLCIAGDEGGLVQVFDINSRAILRTIRAHKQAVHTTKFSPGAGTQLLTTSSDTTVRLFDLSTSAELRSFNLHTDYVRTAAFVPSAPSLIFSGGYDGTVRLWDARVPASEGGGQAWMGRHGKPVEAVTVGDQGTLAVSAGGPILRVWDMLGASTSRGAGVFGAEEEEDTGTSFCVKALSNHQKTITSLCWGESEQGERRLLSGGLDGLVKVYDPQDNWRVKHTMRYGGQVMTVAVSPNSSHLLAGLSDGTLSIRTRVPTKSLSSLSPAEPSYEALLAGAGAGGLAHHGAAAQEGLKASFEGEQVALRDRKRRLNEWDRLLKDFRYGDALDAVLKPNVTAATAFALLTELIHRNGLAIALANRHDLSLEPVLRFLLKHVTDPRYCTLAADVTGVLLEIYSPTMGLSPLVDKLIGRLQRAVREELEFQRELLQIRGALEMVFAGSQAGAVKRVAL